MSNQEKAPLVGIIMGSDSDLPTMKHASDMLERFSVPYEERIVSAHRTPEKMIKYGREAVQRGLKVIIAGAGGSAHLPGMIASETHLPVLGVAIESTPDPLNSAFGSMLRMPKGVPLATMGKGEAGAANAALVAVRILALHDNFLAITYGEYAAGLAVEVEEKDARLAAIGATAYLATLDDAEYEKQSGDYYFPAR